MRIAWLILIGLLSAHVAQAEDARPAIALDGLPGLLGFEGQGAGDAPSGWSVNPSGTVFADGGTVHTGKYAARLERGPDAAGEFSAMSLVVAADFVGKVVELRGVMRTQDVNGYAGLWLREDTDGKSVAFDNMSKRQLKGTSEWTEYSIKLPLYPDAQHVVFGALLAGTGKAWVDDLQLLVDDKPVWQAPKKPKSIVETDHEFDAGSRVSLKELTPLQIENLKTLGKVWGFLKYHHPAVQAGKVHWDYALLRMLPRIIEAPDRDAANARILAWIEKLGPIPKCPRCARLGGDDLQMRPSLEWIDDRASLGAPLSAKLRAIYANRSVAGRQFFVSLAPGVGNPVFQHEPNYASLKLPDSGFQLLALYRFWNAVEYWSPYRDIIGENWDAVLSEFIPKVALASTAEDYQRQLMALIARLHDGHAGLWSSMKVRPPAGECRLPFAARFIQGKPVVTQLDAQQQALKIGDEISEIDDIPVAELVARWLPYYSGSNDAALLRDISGYMTRGPCGSGSVRVRRGGDDLHVDVPRAAKSDNDSFRYHDLPGDTFRLLSKDIAYLKLSSVKADDARRYVEGASGAKGLIIDIRNYPSDFMVFALGSLLMERETSFVRFTAGDLSNPGSFRWSDPLSLKPAAPRFGGKVVILVDEISQSQAEYTTMAFRAAPNAIVIGSQTAGADGNVSPLTLPGGFRTMISGIGIYYPDKRPTQRVGIVPDIEVKPTIAGIRDGRDEVLEAAIRQIVGGELAEDEIQRLARHGESGSASP